MNQATPHPFYMRETLSDPFPLMAQMRTQGPVALTVDPSGHEILVVTDIRLMEEVAKRTSDFSNRFGHLLMAGGTANPEVAGILASEPLEATLLLTSDDPEHQRYRALVNAAFATGRVAHMEERIADLIDELIDDFVEDGTVDFTGRFAVLLPTYIIADILGLPRDKYDKVKRWSDAVITVVGRMGTPEQEVEAAHMMVEFRRYVKETVRARRQNPRDDLISNLVAARVDDLPPLTDDEAAALTFEIAVAGNETTRNTLMSGMVQLLRRPDQLQALAEDPSLVNNAVEGILRYETPASSMWRIARHDTVLGGVSIAGGSMLLLRYDGGNRDPQRFADPDRFDITRKNARQHVSFGPPSMHRCLGQMLARKEMTLAFPRLLTRLRNIRIGAGSETDYLPSLLLHCIGGLNLDFDPGPRIGKAVTDATPAR